MNYEWTPISEGMPDEDEKDSISDDVLCLVSKFGRREIEYMIVLSTEKGIWYDSMDRIFEDNPDYFQVTHWKDVKPPE